MFFFYIIEESVKKVIKELKSREIIDLKDKIEKIESGLNNSLIHHSEYEREELNQKKDKLNKKLEQKMKEFNEEYKKSKDPEKNIETLIRFNEKSGNYELRMWNLELVARMGD